MPKAWHKPPHELKKPKPSDMIRWAKYVVIDRKTGCWLWQGNKCRKGYGRFWMGGRNHWAHRVGFAFFRRIIPFGMTIDHKCHTPGCVNPWHGRLLTVSDNSKERGTRSAPDMSGIPI